MMENLLVKLMLLAALGTMTFKLSDTLNPGRTSQMMRKASLIEWKPISVWPEEGRRFTHGK